MLSLAMIGFFICIALFVIALSPVVKEERPSLNLKNLGLGPITSAGKNVKKADPLAFLNTVAGIIKPVISAEMRKRVSNDLYMSQSNMTAEVFIFFKFVLTGALLMLLPGVFPADMMVFSILMAIVVGYIGPEMIIRNKIQKVKDDIVRLLPDTVDLLGLCVNAGLDFMMALKWVIEKSPKNIMIRELDNIFQEISVGKPRREALRDMAKKYELPDLSTFARTLIQADKMGTSVSEALNILSEDMRQARYRRGEAMALKAPLKMLVPLLFCIFPVVFILVGAPIFLDFIMNNPMKSLH